MEVEVVVEVVEAVEKEVAVEVEAAAGQLTSTIPGRGARTRRSPSTSQSPR